MIYDKGNSHCQICYFVLLIIYEKLYYVFVYSSGNEIFITAHKKSLGKSNFFRCLSVHKEGGGVGFPACITGYMTIIWGLTSHHASHVTWHRGIHPGGLHRWVCIRGLHPGRSASRALGGPHCRNWYSSY